MAVFSVLKKGIKCLLPHIRASTSCIIFTKFSNKFNINNLKKNILKYIKICFYSKKHIKMIKCHLLKSIYKHIIYVFI